MCRCKWTNSCGSFDEDLEDDMGVIIAKRVYRRLDRGRRAAWGYGAVGAAMREAVAAYVQDVRAGAFPGPEHAFPMPPEELAAFKRMRP